MPPPPPPSDVAILAERLERNFGDHQSVQGVDLEIGSGELYACLGRPRSGKSTLVRMLCGLLPPTEGRARLAGFDVIAQRRDAQLRVGAVLPEQGLDPLQTGRELLAMHGRLYGLRGRELEARLGEVGALGDLGPHLDRRVSASSGGVRRRLELALSLVHNPEVLLIDEATPGLDAESTAQVRAMLQRVRLSGEVTVLLATQDPEEAEALADRVGILAFGRIVAEGTPTELKDSLGPEVMVVRVHTDVEEAARVLRDAMGIDDVTMHRQEVTVRAEAPATLVPGVVSALRDADVAVADVSVRPPTLDDVFVELTGTRLADAAAVAAVAGG